MQIPKLKSLAGDAWLTEMCRRDDLELPESYERPLRKIKRSKNPFTNEVVKRSFAQTVYRGVSQYLP